MEETPENGKESSHSAHTNGMTESIAKVAKCEVLTVVLFSKEGFWM
jgi:hypothetical protein